MPVQRSYYFSFTSLLPIILSIVFISPAIVNAQNREDNLKEEKKQIEEQIVFTNKLLAETSQNKRQVRMAWSYSNKISGSAKGSSTT